MIIVAITSFVLVSACQPAETINKHTDSNQPIATKEATNPLIKAPHAWFDRYPEHPVVLNIQGTYYMYFHAGRTDMGWHIGLATSNSPNGPWTVKSEPVLAPSPDSWDSLGVACPYVMKKGNQFYMWYSGSGPHGWNVGLATASTPEGPWSKHRGEPLLQGGWVGSVQEVGGTYYMWRDPDITERFVMLATAPQPEGPWTDYGVVLTPSPPGSWDGYGVSGESAVVYHQGVFHMFFPGSSEPPPGIMQTNEIGYATSHNGKNWYRHPSNPVITRGKEGEWDSYRLSETGVLIEDGIFYVYYTGIHYQKGATTPTEGISLASIRIPDLAKID